MGRRGYQTKPVKGNEIYVENEGQGRINQAEIWDKSMLAIMSGMCKGFRFGEELNDFE